MSRGGVFWNFDFCSHSAAMTGALGHCDPLRFKQQHRRSVAAGDSIFKFSSTMLCTCLVTGKYAFLVSTTNGSPVSPGGESKHYVGSVFRRMPAKRACHGIYCRCTHTCMHSNSYTITTHLVPTKCLWWESGGIAEIKMAPILVLPGASRQVS